MANNYDYVAIVNAVNAEVGGMYKYHFPIGESIDFKAMAAAMMEAPNDVINAYINTLRNVMCNTIIRKVYKDNNPFRKFYRKPTNLTGSGDQYVIERAIDQFIPMAYEITSTPESFFESAPPKVKQQFLCNVLRVKYVVTINRFLLASAFDNEGSLSDFFSTTMDRMYKDMSEDSKEATMAAIDAVIEGGNMYIMPFTRPRDSSTALAFSTMLEVLSTDLSFNRSRDYNLQHLSTKSDEDDTVLMLAADVTATQNNYNLAWAFNRSYLDLYNRGQIVKVDSKGFAHNRVFMIYTDTEYFRLYPISGFPVLKYWENGENLEEKRWLHNWEMVSFSYFSNAIAFAEPKDIGVASIEILDKEGKTASTVKKGKFLELGLPKVTAQEGKLADCFVNYSISGNTSKDTRIDQSGTLYVAKDETADTITITGVSHLDESKTADYTVTVAA